MDMHDPITLLRGGRLVHVLAGGNVDTAFPEEEGSTWVRGHVTAADPIGAALLAAGGLARVVDSGIDWTKLGELILPVFK